MATIKQEGAPQHPDDLDWECSCERCAWKYQRQLREYWDWHGRRHDMSPAALQASPIGQGFL